MERAVLLAAGCGSRSAVAQAGVVLTPEQTAVAEAGLKALLPLGGFRLMLAEIGVRRVLVVLGPNSGELTDHLVGLRPRRLSIEMPSALPALRRVLG